MYTQKEKKTVFLKLFHYRTRHNNPYNKYKYQGRTLCLALCAVGVSALFTGFKSNTKTRFWAHILPRMTPAWFRHFGAGYQHHPGAIWDSSHPTACRLPMPGLRNQPQTRTDTSHYLCHTVAYFAHAHDSQTDTPAGNATPWCLFSVDSNNFRSFSLAFKITQQTETFNPSICKPKHEIMHVHENTTICIWK